MDSKELFNRVHVAQQEIRLLALRRRKYIEMASCAAGMSDTGIRGSGQGSRTEQAAMQLIELADRMGNTIL